MNEREFLEFRCIFSRRGVDESEKLGRLQAVLTGFASRSSDRQSRFHRPFAPYLGFVIVPSP